MKNRKKLKKENPYTVYIPVDKLWQSFHCLQYFPSYSWKPFYVGFLVVLNWIKKYWAPCKIQAQDLKGRSLHSIVPTELSKLLIIGSSTFKTQLPSTSEIHRNVTKFMLTKPIVNVLFVLRKNLEIFVATSRIVFKYS